MHVGWKGKAGKARLPGSEGKLGAARTPTLRVQVQRAWFRKNPRDQIPNRSGLKSRRAVCRGRSEMTTRRPCTGTVPCSPRCRESLYTVLLTELTTHTPRRPGATPSDPLRHPEPRAPDLTRADWTDTGHPRSRRGDLPGGSGDEVLGVREGGSTATVWPSRRGRSPPTVGGSSLLVTDPTASSRH